MSYPPGPYQGPPEWHGQPPPGYPAPHPGWPPPREPDNYLVWAVLVTVLCCVPFGIVSLVYSSRVSGQWAQGRYAEAQASADNAKKWAIIGAVASGVFWVAMAMLWVFFFAVGVSVSHLPSTTTTTYSF
ncbi:CD225/dispanin family protein [Mycobacterium palustre]|uniref:Interferon-induced transmembrane protein n=1 Tax=Mycobacterium palustre TaxID=153971 RepID=A0A1X1ZPN9_9MYCO|nr:CD225/dispanin family protein [Mycobacterium palustre]MCV7101903.1 CD225/dispanin family protein [Mycobacterium palustre]ORW25282.1 hypothetical protein AWC19_07250 [Mycobacterium palustre]ORW25312.1 hypothetical protein AWC19_07430 [Mycobacterium palustre]